MTEEAEGAAAPVEKRSPFDQWKTTCPHCYEEGSLELTSGTFMAQGVPLHRDGFSLSDADHLDTSDEIVTCNSCHKSMKLETLVHDYVPPKRKRRKKNARK